MYTDEEMKKILTYTNDKRDVWSDCITLIFITGLRVGEAVALKHEDINPQNLSITVNRTETRFEDENGVVHLCVEEDVKTEAGKRIVYVPKKYQYLLTSLWWNSSATEYVFEYKEKRIITNSIRNKLRRICKKLNIVYRSPHKIRKTYCSILLDDNVDKRFITSQVGHVDISVTEQSYHRDRKNSVEKVDRLSAIGEFN